MKYPYRSRIERTRRGGTRASDYLGYVARLEARGDWICAAGLHDGRDSTTMRNRSGSTSITDGPFAETKEIVFASMPRGVATARAPTLVRRGELHSGNRDASAGARTAARSSS
jgi:hypothetical protein